MQSHLALMTSLGRTTLEGADYEVFAEAHAEYDPQAKRLSVAMESYLRPEELTRLSERLVPEWLPRPQTDREHVDPDEASDLAKEVFHRWCEKVKSAVPHLRH